MGFNRVLKKTKMEELLNNFTEYPNIKLIILGWFFSFIISEKLGISYYFKKLFRIKQTTNVKLLDCYPCFSFWFSLLLSLNLFTAIIVYYIAIKIDKHGS